MTRSRPPKCPCGRGCGVCGAPVRVDVGETLKRIAEREAREDVATRDPAGDEAEARLLDEDSHG